MDTWMGPGTYRTPTGFDVEVRAMAEVEPPNWRTSLDAWVENHSADWPGFAKGLRAYIYADRLAVHFDVTP